MFDRVEEDMQMNEYGQLGMHCFFGKVVAFSVAFVK